MTSSTTLADLEAALDEADARLGRASLRVQELTRRGPLTPGVRVPLMSVEEEDQAHAELAAAQAEFDQAREAVRSAK
jgi:multidrug resistance efflux pump